MIFLLFALHEVHLEIAGNGRSRLRKSNCFRKCTPRTPPSRLVRVLEHHYLNALNFATEEDCKKDL